MTTRALTCQVQHSPRRLKTPLGLLLTLLLVVSHAQPLIADTASGTVYLGNIFAAGALISQDGTETRGPKAVSTLFSEMIIFYDDAGNEVPYTSKACTPRTRHVTTNIIMEIDNNVEVAKVRSYFTVY